MDPTAFFAVLVVILIAGALWLYGLRARMEAQSADLRRDMQGQLQHQQQAVTSLLGQLTALVTQQLSAVRSDLQKGVAASGDMAVRAQSAVKEELRETRDMLNRVSQQLGEVHQAGAQLSQASHTLQTILGGAKTRGILGEMALGQMLADTLPAGAFALQHRFMSGEAVDAVVHAGDKLICIDSKFPLEAYRRLTDGGEEFRKDFSKAVRSHVDAIAGKYILPGEGTLDIALLFVPSESIYYELLVTEDARGRLDDHCRRQRVIPVSPNTLYAYLGAILMGLKGMQVEENARHLLENIGGLDRQMQQVAEVFEKLGIHLKNAVQAHADAQARLERSRISLAQMAQGALPQATPAAPFALEVVEPPRRKAEGGS
jgi:DNA recombination protein RmuC